MSFRTRPVPTCDARLRLRTGEVNGFPRSEPVLCGRSSALRSFVDGVSVIRHYCSTTGHERSTRYWHPVAA